MVLFLQLQTAPEMFFVVWQALASVGFSSFYSSPKPMIGLGLQGRNDHTVGGLGLLNCFLSCILTHFREIKTAHTTLSCIDLPPPAFRGLSLPLSFRAVFFGALSGFWYSMVSQAWLWPVFPFISSFSPASTYRFGLYFHSISGVACFTCIHLRFHGFFVPVSFAPAFICLCSKSFPASRDRRLGLGVALPSFVAGLNCLSGLVL